LDSAALIYFHVEPSSMEEGTMCHSRVKLTSWFPSSTCDYTEVR